MPNAATVWAVELGRGAMKERKGSLSLQADAIAFEATDGSGHIRIALADLRKARRVRGSPVLMVTSRGQHGNERTAFYFVQPPPLEPAPRTADRPSFLSLGRQSRRKTRRQNAGYLGLWNREKKDELAEWERAINGAIRAARG